MLMVYLCGNIREADGGHSGGGESGGIHEAQSKLIKYYPQLLGVAGFYSVQHAPLVHQISMRLESAS